MKKFHIHLALRARAILLVFEKFTHAYLFQITREISFDYRYKFSCLTFSSTRHHSFEFSV